MARTVVRIFLLIGVFLQLHGVPSEVRAESAASEKISILTSVPPQAYFLDRLGGGRFQVEVIVPPTANHNVYEPNVNQLKTFTKAKAYFTIGHPAFSFEHVWVERITVLHPDLKIVNTFAGARLRPGDPHIWVSLRETIPMVNAMAVGLTAIDPTYAKEIDAEKNVLIAEISKLAESFSAKLAAHPQRKTPRYFITAHPYWGYLADEYNIVQLAIEEEGKEPSPVRLAEIIDIGRKHGIKLVLVQPQYSEQAAFRVAHEIGAELMELDPFAYDWMKTMQRTIEIFNKALS